jgi:type I restriction enzyme S subunit
MMGNGTIYKAVTKGDVQCIPILDPGEPLATEYEKIASTLWAEILTLHSANGLLSEAREILLPRLVSGRVDLEAAFERTEAAA